VQKKDTFQFNLGNLLPDLTLYPWVLGHKLRLYLHCQKVIINFGYIRQMLKEPTSWCHLRQQCPGRFQAMTLLAGRVDLYSWVTRSGSPFSVLFSWLPTPIVNYTPGETCPWPVARTRVLWWVALAAARPVQILDSLYSFFKVSRAPPERIPTTIHPPSLWFQSCRPLSPRLQSQHSGACNTHMWMDMLRDDTYFLAR